MCSAFINGWVWMLVMVGITEEIQLQRTVDASAEVVIGMTEEEVRQILGAPNYAWKSGPAFLFGTRPAEWIYGTNLDLSFVILGDLPILNPLPVKLRIRLFGADEKDLVIDWTPEKRVAKITRPVLNFPELSAQHAQFVYSLYDLLSFANLIADSAAKAQPSIPR